MKLRPWTKKRGALFAFGVFLVADLGLGVHTANLAIAASAAADPAPASPSAKTIAWNDEQRAIDDPNFESFKNLEVTVSQTEGLRNQGISVSWSGARATSTGDYSTNYLQIMQCWGDVAPSPSTCQWGEPAANLGSLMGSNTGGRALVANEDPAQAYDGEFLIPPPRNNPNQRAYAVPFVSVKGEKTYDNTRFFTATSSNEITAARTGQDGTGTLVFETQTSLEAPHLGCGVAAAGSTVGRSCWLVVVPRGEFNADGSPSSTDAAGRVVGSPLSAGNWKNRVEVKLGFEAIGSSCPIGRAEQRTVGTELVAEAFTSWQAALCAGGTTYGFSQVGDSEARRQVVSTLDGAAGLAFVSRPLSAETSTGSTLAYAPVVGSAIVVAYNIERNLKGNAANFALNGTAVNNLTLNQRLVAKLLTQSYRSDVPNGNNQPHVASNPRSLRSDPEFLALNPEFVDFSSSSEPDGLMVSLGSTDATSEVWRWIQADPDARDFLRGTADEWGMTINPAYLALDIANDPIIDSFPKADLSTYRQFSSIPEPGFGTLDLRPYVNDMHEGAYRARRADGNVKIVWDDTRNPPSFVSTGPQLPGQRFSLVITDATSAERFGLNTAKLVNSAGKAVEATPEAIAAGIAALVPSEVEGVKVVDATKRENAVYPLSMMTYAVVNVCSPNLDALRDYANLLEYSAGAGQVQGDGVGQLPDGYVALDAEAKALSAATQKVIRAEIAKPACAQHQKPEVIPPGEEAEEEPTDFVPEEEEEETASPVEPAATPSPSPTPAEVMATPSSKNDASKYAFWASLLFAIPCLGSGPLLLRKS